MRLKLFKYYLFLFVWITIVQAKADTNPYRDSLLTYLKVAPEDTNKVKCLKILFFEYEFEDNQLAKKYANQGLKLSQKINYN